MYYPITTTEGGKKGNCVKGSDMHLLNCESEVTKVSDKMKDQLK